MGVESSTRTPPQIVAAADDPASALIAFVAQELERWGFTITSATPGLGVHAGDVTFYLAADVQTGI